MGRETPYCSVDEFMERAAKVIEDQGAAILAALLAASRKIDGWTGQFFYLTGSEIRYFTQRPPALGYSPWAYANRSVLTIDPFVTVTEVEIDRGERRLWETTYVLGDDYLPGPTGAPDQAEPYRFLEGVGSRSFPYGRDAIKVGGTWGYPVVPAPISEACFLIANRSFSTWKAPFGVAGSGELGQLRQTVDLTPSIKELIAPYRVMPV